MQHAGEEALNRLESTLIRIRLFPGLKELQRGVFYKKYRAFLHFHEDKKGLFADVKVNEEWKRMPCTTFDEQDALMDFVRKEAAREPSSKGEGGRSSKST